MQAHQSAMLECARWAGGTGMQWAHGHIAPLLHVMPCISTGMSLLD